MNLETLAKVGPFVPTKSWLGAMPANPGTGEMLRIAVVGHATAHLFGRPLLQTAPQYAEISFEDAVMLVALSLQMQDGAWEFIATKEGCFFEREHLLPLPGIELLGNELSSLGTELRCLTNAQPYGGSVDVDVDGETKSDLLVIILSTDKLLALYWDVNDALPAD